MRAFLASLTLCLLVPFLTPAAAITFACADPAPGVPTPQPLTIQIPAQGTQPTFCSPAQLAASNLSNSCLAAAPVPPGGVPVINVDVLCGEVVVPGKRVECSTGPGMYNNLVVAIDRDANGAIDPLDQVFYDSVSPTTGGAEVRFVATVVGRLIATIPAGLTGSTVQIGCFVF